LLLDTHALIWALAQPRHLPVSAATAIRDSANSVAVSAASTWEIAIKAALGKIAADLEEIVRAVRTLGFGELAVTVAHTTRLRQLPPHHRDPFDRILVAQALEDGFTIVTHDRAFAAYAAPILWR